MGAYAVSDLHGCYSQWRQIQSFCKDSDRIFVLGDCIDRSTDGLDVLKSVMRDPRATLILGNHEDMMLEALDNEIKYNESDYWTWRWFSNGGQPTYDSWVKDGMNFDWITILKHVPLYATYTNEDGIEVLMNHSGIMPKLGYPMSSCTRRLMLWDRDCLKTKHWHHYDNQIIVHGHTPQMLMPQFKNKDVELEPGALWYCDQHRCNIDTGACWTGQVCLLDLNNFDEHIFEGG